MKFKNLIFLSLFTGLFISSLLEFISDASLQYKIGKEDFKIKTSGLDDSWNIGLENFGMDMVIDLNNCIYVMIPDRYYRDVIIIKYNNYGNQLWRLSLDGLRVYSSKITVDSQSNLYLASMYDNQTTDDNMILFKFNSSGNLKWQQTWNGGNNGDVIDIAIDLDDSIYVYGTSDLAKKFNFDLFIVKYISSGDQQWFHVYEELGGDYNGWDMEIDSNGNIIVSGVSYLSDNHFFWIKWFNQSGDLKLNITSNKSGFYFLAVDSLDNLISVNRTSIVKFDNIGNLIWKCDHQIERSWQVKIALDSFSNIYAATSVSIPEDHHTYDLYLIKINNSGDFDCYLTWGGAGKDDLKAINIDSYDNIYLLSEDFLIKNPENNGKSLTNIKLWNFYMILFGICFVISIISLLFIIKEKGDNDLEIKSDND
ncbi:MAG: hypothetical protein KAW51_08930 [Candidatus Lokiarchaeota archaeon]|nr:hypothetical protein [Candidatus Lokiarchaeota archaeon]